MKKVILAAGLCLALGWNASANATVLTYQFFTSFGAVPSDGPAPWLTMAFDDDTGNAKSVELTITASLASPEHVKEVYFNFGPTIGLPLTFNHQSGTAANTISQSADSFKADGTGGFFDILMDFQPGSIPYNGTSVYELVSGGDDISALNFFFPAVDSLYNAAAHIGSTGGDNEGSDWIAAIGGSTDIEIEAPEPASAAILGVGLMALAGISRRRRKA